MSPSSGSGTMTPIGVPAVSGLAEPLPYTLLSIFRFAKIMGIPPMHFARGSTPGLSPRVFPETTCESVWYKYDWQDADKVSWYQLALTIQAAEHELATLLGWWPAPVWIENEEYPYPRPYRREYFGIGLDVRNELKGISLNTGKFIGGGRRAVSLVGTATVAGGSLTYSDQDGDGYEETATIVLATALTDEREIKAYFAGFDGVQEWEIRPTRSVSISGGNVTMVFDSWQFIDPDLYEEYPTDDDVNGLDTIDISTPTNFVTSVEVYREYTDTTQAAARFYWESDCVLCGGLSDTCSACSPLTQDGCLSTRNGKAGIAVPAPASYDSVEARWEQAGWSGPVEPQRVHLWYKAGEVSQEYEKRRKVDPLSDFWAKTIAWLATSRIERGLCGCTNVQAISAYLREDLLISNREQSIFVPIEVQNCPLGTTRGEVAVWKRIKHFIKDKRLSVALI